LADADLNQGNAAGAVQRLEQSLAAFGRVSGGAEDRRAGVLSILGAARFQVGDYVGSFQAFKALGDLCRKTRDRKGEALALQAQAALAVNLGERDQAEKLMEEGLTLSRSLADRDLEIQALFNRGALSWKNDPRRALEAFEAYLELIRKPGSTAREHREEVIPLGFLARAYANLGNTARARELADAAVAAAEADGEGFDRALARDHRAYVHFRTGHLREAEEDARAALDLFEKEEEKLGDAELAKVGALDQKATLPDLLQQVLVREGKPAEALAVAERRRARLFSEALTGRRAEAPSTETLAQAVRNLRATVIEYSILYDPADLLLPGRIEGLQSDLEEELYIWVVQPDGRIAFRSVDLKALRKNGSTLGVSVRYLLQRLESGKATEAELRPLLRDLHETLIAPIADLLPRDAGTPVVVVPHGTLFLVPFAALVDGSGQPFIQQHSLITAPSITSLAGLRRPGKPETWRGAGALIVGNPWFSPRADQFLPPLPATEKESRGVAEVLGANVLLGASATKAAVTRALPSAHLIHLATHGMPEQGGNRFLSGALAFAPTEPGEDGLLTAPEIRSLHLTADLVVLSACRTAQGRISGDGVIGLSRSFLAAGAAAVVTSLWRIDDEATSTLMVDFYRNLRVSGDSGAALRSAQLSSIRRGESPQIWGAFTYLGVPSAAGSPETAARRAARRSGGRF
jgi:CHAT domain-containing protein